MIVLHIGINSVVYYEKMKHGITINSVISVEVLMNVTRLIRK